MNSDGKSFSSSEMGVRDTGSPVDCLPFHILEREIDRLLLDDTPPQNSNYSLNPTPSTFNPLNPLLEQKIKYFREVSNNIDRTKKNFEIAYANVEKSIDKMMERLVMYLEARQRQLKDQLRDIAVQKNIRWDRQLIACRNAISELQIDSFSNGPNFNFYSRSNEFEQEIQFIDAGDIIFEADDYTEVLKSLGNLGNIKHQSEYNWLDQGLHSLKAVAPKFTFGSGGAGPGQFCRPWGVCSDSSGRILVCDRSNHRIQIFNLCGEYIFHFGKEGSNPGEFNRPTGITVDRKNRIIVADKDNHRIQIFTYYGNFLLQFGTQGKNLGEFLYPWDVACNSKCEIAVSDSKNHRIQLFNENGVFLTHFDGKKSNSINPRIALRILDSPRGLAFSPDGSLFVTDFNNHRILILSNNFKKFSTFGGEGMKPGEFFRPQGIACDSRGKFAVADSKNYRIQVFNQDKKLLKSFGCQGKEIGQFDCPQGICFHPNQNIIVVDFNNTRIQVF